MRTGLRALAGAAWLAAALLFGGLAAPPASAQTEVPVGWGLIPSGLGAGDTFRLLIVTSTTHNATSTDIDVYDGYVQTAVAAGHTDIQDHSDAFKVLGSTGTVNARVHTSTQATDTSAPIYYLNGVKVADDYADLYDGSWDGRRNVGGTMYGAVPRDENGAEVGADDDYYPEDSAPFVWTGTSSNGTTADEPLGGMSLGNTVATYGVPRSPDFEFDNGHDNSSVFSYHLYGLSPVFKVAAAVTNTDATGAPSISGTPQVGQELTAGAGDMADDDGLPGTFPDDYSFQWVSVSGGTETDIAGETSSTYMPVAADVGNTIKVKVSFEDDAGFDEGPLASAETAAVLRAAEDCAADRPDADWCTTMTAGFRGGRISGSGFNATLSNVLGSLDDNMIDYGASFESEVSVIENGHQSSGDELIVNLDPAVPDGTVFDLGGTEFTVDADSTLPTAGEYKWDAPTGFARWLDGQKVTVSAELGNFAAEGKPAVTGTATVNSTLTAGSGTLADVDGLPATTFPDGYTFQWHRVDADGVSNKTEISGATSHEYTLTASEQGKRVIVEASFTDAAGNSEGPLASDPYPSTGTVTSTDTAAPLFSSATVDGATLVITFNEDLAAAANLANTAFTVKKTPSSGTETTVTLSATAPSISGATVTLTLSAAVVSTDTVTVSYAKPTSDSNNRLEDTAGNEVADFTDKAVTNETAAVNADPTVENEIDDQPATVGEAFSFTFADDTFEDANGDTLTYTATRGDDTALPAWLTFTPGTRTFAGTPGTFDSGELTVKVTADDGAGGSASDEFVITVSNPPCAEIWCAKLKVQDIPTANLGCGSGNVLQDSQQCSNSAVLTEDEFNHDSTDYTIETVMLRTGLSMELYLDTDLTGNTGSLVLLVGDADRFALAHPTTQTSSFRRWEMAGLNWTAGDVVDLKLVAGSTDATLSGLVVNDGSNDLTLDPTFDPADTFYYAQVGNAVTQVTVTPTASDANARVSYDTDDADAADGHQVDLEVGTNEIVVTVTAEDGMAKEDYTVVLARAPSAPANCGTDDIWCATLAVNELIIGGTVEGHGFSPSTSAGALSDDDFIYDSVDYEVLEIVVPSANSLEFSLEPDGSTVFNADEYTLFIDGAPFNFDDATFNIITFRWASSGLSWSDGDTVTVRLVENTDATGAPEIDGTPQVGQTLTAEQGDIADDDGLPGTFPDDYSFQWVSVSGGTETDISGETSQTYMPVAADVGKTLKVKVSFEDDAGRTETLASAETAAVVRAAEDCATDRPGNDWCTTMTVGVQRFGSESLSGFSNGIYHSLVFGSLDDDTLDYGPSYEVEAVFAVRFGPSSVQGEVYLDAFVPRGSVFDLGGMELTTRQTSDVGRYVWAFPDNFAWLDGQKVTVSANLAPGIETATVDGTSLVLTYAEDLDTNSTPDKSAYTVTVGTTEQTPTAVTVSGKTVTLTLGTAVTATDTDVTVSYDPEETASSPLQDLSGLDAPALTNRPVTNNTGATNTDASGMPAITGAPQVGQTLTANRGTIADANGLPGTFPDDYTFQWVSVSGGTETDIAGETSSTYMPVAGDIGKTLKVKVSFEDDAGSEEGPLASDATAAVVRAAEDCADRPGNDWCTIMTVDVGLSGPFALAGFLGGLGSLDDTTIEYGTGDGLEVTELYYRTGIENDVVVTLDDSIPLGSVFDLGGTEFTFEAVQAGLTRTYVWPLPTDFAWLHGQLVTVSANLAPGVESATVDGTSLVLTYAEDLDTGSTPDKSRYTVTVDGTDQTPSTVEVSSRKVTLTLGTAVTSGQTVTVSYRVPTSSPLQDLSGLDAPALADHEVTNDTLAPGEEGTWGDHRLVVDNEGTRAPAPAAGVTATGRLEVYYKKQWGTVCNDRFARDFTVHGRDENDDPTRKTVSNKAGELACQIMGYETGSMVSRSEAGMTSIIAPATKPIHLDDVRCAAEEADWRLNRNKDPNDPDWRTSRARLDQCYHAGIGLQNCYIGAHEETIINRTLINPAPVDPATGEPYPDHEYDVHLQCTGTAPQAATQVVATQLTATFENVPASHDGATPFTVGIRFNEAPHGAEGELTDEALQEMLGVTNGTVTSVSRVDGDGARRIATIAPAGAGNVSLSLLPSANCTDAPALCTGSGGGLATAVLIQVRAGPPAFSAAFENAPEAHDGASVFRVEIRFNKHPKVWNKRLRTILQASMTGGTVETVNRVDREDPLLRYADIAPDGDGPVTLSLDPVADCDHSLAVCTQDGEPLSAGIALEVPGPEAAPEETVGPPDTETADAPFTARFANAPEVHQGSGRFTVDLVFSETPRGTGGTPPSMTNRSLLDALEVSGGEIAKVVRIARSPTERRVTVEPDDEGAVTLGLSPRADCADAGAVCTGDGRMLSAAATVTIEGPPGLSVADARAEEGPGVDMTFTVTLDRSVTVDVTVDYRTEDVAGLAEAGADYEAASGTLAFAAGDTEKTIAVRLLDDDHDEGAESFLLWLENPTNAYLDDFVAVGTIENTDPMPRAWLARFGRTVAEQVLDAVESRMRAGPRAGMEMTVVGQRLGGGSPDAEALEEAGEEARLLELSSWLRGEACRNASDASADCPAGTPGSSRALTGRDLLKGSSFALTGGSTQGGFASLWGRGAVSRFDGREGELTLDGEVASVMLGTDWTRDRWTAGLLLSHARGEGGYRGADTGEVDSTLTGLYPWGRYAMNDRVTVWGTAGYGVGTLTLVPDGKEPLETDMDLAMAAAGLRGVVVAAPAEGGAELAVKTDAMAVRTSSAALADAAAGSLAASTAEVTRLRLGLEGTWRGLVLGTGTLAPRLEVGVRHDGGDAETGFGLDLGAGLAWSDPETGFSAEASGRGLLTHESAGFGQRGFAGRLGWDPRPETDRGPSLTLTQSVGLASSGGADALLGRRTLEGLAANDDGDELERRRFEMKLGYGFAVFGDRYTSVPEAGLGWSERVRETVLGWRLSEERRAGLAFGLDVEGARREPADGDGEAAHRLGLGLGWRLVGAPGGAFEARFEGARIEPANDDGPEHRLGLGMTVRW